MKTLEKLKVLYSYWVVIYAPKTLITQDSKETRKNNLDPSKKK